VFNTSPLQLLFVAFPDAMQASLSAFARCGSTSLVARAALVIAWQITGWWIVVSCLRRLPAGDQGAVRWS